MKKWWATNESVESVMIDLSLFRPPCIYLVGHLPTDLMFHLFTFLNDDDAGRLGRVCHYLQHQLNHGYYFRTIFIVTLPVVDHSARSVTVNDVSDHSDEQSSTVAITATNRLVGSDTTPNHFTRELITQHFSEALSLGEFTGKQHFVRCHSPSPNALLSSRLCGRIQQLVLHVQLNSIPILSPRTYIKLPPSLTHLYVMRQAPLATSLTHEWTDAFIHQAVPRLRHITFTSNAWHDFYTRFLSYFFEDPNDWLRFAGRLHSLRIEGFGRYGDLRQFTSLKYLTIHGFYDLTTFHTDLIFPDPQPLLNLLLPASLLQFRCGPVYCPAVDSPMNLWLLPPELEVLVLPLPASESYDSLPGMAEMQWPNSLTELSLGDFCGPISSKSLPRTLLRLTSSLVFIEPMDQVRLPPHLHTLILSGRKSSSHRPELASLSFPPSLTELQVPEGFSHGLTWPSTLKRLVLL